MLSRKKCRRHSSMAFSRIIKTTISGKCCGFHAVEFFNEHHPDPHMPEQFDQEDGLFRFEKRMAD